MTLSILSGVRRKLRGDGSSGLTFRTGTRATAVPVFVDRLDRDITLSFEILKVARLALPTFGHVPIPGLVVARHRTSYASPSHPGGFPRKRRIILQVFCLQAHNLRAAPALKPAMPASLHSPRLPALRMPKSTNFRRSDIQRHARCARPMLMVEILAPIGKAYRSESLLVE